MESAKRMIINEKLLRFRIVRHYFKKVAVFLNTPLVKFTYRFVSDLSSVRVLEYLSIFKISSVYINNVPSSNRIHIIPSALNLPLGTLGSCASQLKRSADNRDTSAFARHCTCS